MITNFFYIKKKIIELNSCLFYLFYLIRFLPLIILTNDWILFDNHGLFFFFSKFTLMNLLNSMKIKELTILMFLVLLIFIQLVLLLYFYLFEKNKSKTNKHKFSEEQRFNILVNLILWVFIIFIFYFANVPLELASFASFNRKCKDDNPIYITMNLSSLKNIFSNCTDSSIFSFIVSAVFIISSFIFNYIFDLYFFSPFKLKFIDFSGFLRKSNYGYLILPLINIYIMLEKVFFLNYYFLIIKLTLRVIFLVLMLVRFKNIPKTILNKFSFFLELFCMFSVLLDFISFSEVLSLYKNFNSNNNQLTRLQDFQENPSKFSYFFEAKYLLIKFILQFMLAYLLLDFVSKRSLNNSADLYKINKSILYSMKKNICYLNKFLFYVYNYEHYVKADNFDFLIILHDNLLSHKISCQDLSCDCSKNIEKFKELNSILDNETKIAETKKLLIKNIEKILDAYHHKNKNNDTANQIEINFFSIVFNTFLQKKYVSAYFELEKLKKYKFIKTNYVMKTKLEILKHEIIEEQIRENEKSKDTKKINLFRSFLRHNNYTHLMNENCIIFDIYNQINENISKNERNRKIKNREYFNSNDKNKFYNFEKLLADFSILIRSYNENSLFSLDISRSERSLDKSLNNNISIFNKFFSGADPKKDDIISNFNTKEIRGLSLLKIENNIINEATNFEYLNVKKFEDNLFSKKSIYKQNIISNNNGQMLILKQNEEGRLIFKKISLDFADELEYKSSEIVGKGIDFLLPLPFIEMHEKHVYKFLHKNSSLIRDKEIYFISKNGYCKNYCMVGMLIITLDQEVLIYAELKKIINEKTNCFISFDFNGDIIAYDKNIQENLFIDNCFMKYIKPNFYKNFFDIQEIFARIEKQNLQINKENSHIKYNVIASPDKKPKEVNGFEIKKIKENNKVNLLWKENKVKNYINDNRSNNDHTFEANEINIDLSAARNNSSFISIDDKASKTELKKELSTSIKLNKENSITIDYMEIINKLRKSDFSKINELKYNSEISHNTVTNPGNLNYLERLDSIANIFEEKIYNMNTEKLFSLKRVEDLKSKLKNRRVYFTFIKRSLLNSYYFYDLYLDFSQVGYLNMIKSLISNKSGQNKYTNCSLGKVYDYKLTKISDFIPNKPLIQQANLKEKFPTLESNNIQIKENPNINMNCHIKNFSFKNNYFNPNNPTNTSEDENIRHGETLDQANNKMTLENFELMSNVNNEKIFDISSIIEKEKKRKMFKNINIERKFLFEILKLIKYLTIFFREDKETLELNLNTLQIFVDNYYFCNNSDVKKQVEKGFFNFYKNNKFELSDGEAKNLSMTNTDLTRNVNRRFVILIFLLFLFIFIFSIIDIISYDYYNNCSLFSDFSQYSYTLKSYYSLISNSLLSIYLVQDSIEQPVYFLNYISENNNKIIKYNNSFEYQMNKVKARSDLFMEKFYYFRNIYYNNKNFLFRNKNILTESIRFKFLSQNWQEYNETLTLYENLNLFHLYSNSLTKSEILNTRLDIFSDKNLNNLTPPKKSEVYLFFSLQNTVNPIITSFQNLIAENYANIFAYIATSQIYVFYMYFFSSLICVIIFILEMVLLLKNYKVVNLKLNILANYLKIFNQVIIDKIGLIKEIINDSMINEKFLIANSFTINKEAFEKFLAENEKENKLTHDYLFEIKDNNQDQKDNANKNKLNQAPPKYMSPEEFNHVKISYVNEKESNINDKYDFPFTFQDNYKLGLKKVGSSSLKKETSNGMRKKKLRKTSSFEDLKDTGIRKNAPFDLNNNHYVNGDKKTMNETFEDSEPKEQMLKIDQNMQTNSHLKRVNVSEELNFSQEIYDIRNETRNINLSLTLDNSSRHHELDLENFKLNNSDFLNENNTKKINTQNIGNNLSYLIKKESLIHLNRDSLIQKLKLKKFSNKNLSFKKKQNLINMKLIKRNNCNIHPLNYNQKIILESYLSSLCFVGIRQLEGNSKWDIKKGRFNQKGNLNFQRFQKTFNNFNKNASLRSNKNNKNSLKNSPEKYNYIKNPDIEDSSFNKNYNLNFIDDSIKKSMKINLMNKNNLCKLNKAEFAHDQLKINLQYHGVKDFIPININNSNHDQLDTKLINKGESTIVNNTTHCMLMNHNTHTDKLLLLSNSNNNGKKSNQNILDSFTNNVKAYNDFYKNLNLKDINHSNTNQGNRQNDCTEEMLFNNIANVLNNNSEENSQQTIYIDYSKPQSYFLFRNFMIFLICVLIAISVAINSFIYNSFYNIKQFYIVKNSFIRRNAILFDSFYFFKMSVVNKQLPIYDLFKNNTNFNMFDESIKTLEENINIIMQFNNDEFLDNFNLKTVKFIENCLQSRYFCEYFIYLNNKTNLKTITDNINITPHLNDDYIQRLKNTSSEFMRKSEDCVFKTGNLFSSGLYEFLNAAKFILVNSFTDFQKFLAQNSQIQTSDDAYKQKIREYFSSPDIIKLNYSLRKILYEMSEIYLQLIGKSEEHFKEDIKYTQALGNYSLLSLVLIICLLYLKILSVLICIPDEIVTDACNIVKNSLYFKIV